ncbi:hypothetical protein I5S84_09965 [Pseudomonas putida]|uniref:Uncharacterized protein n=1 Tax=Pseudomonas putida TaxID=303 RepID=A0A6I7ETQ0_PSEPU|nr:hypothetical protein [Pseudomonas putida]MBH3449172.1 hypothetical protein [Pseudomonas putida]QHW08379.1 hypothetical protein C2H86_28450 [Pseudomonas putida]
MTLCTKDEERKRVGFTATLARALAKASVLGTFFKLGESSGKKLAFEQINKPTVSSVVDESPVMATGSQETPWMIEAYCWNGVRHAPVTVAAQFGEERIKALLSELQAYHLQMPELTQLDALMKWRAGHPLGGKAVFASYFRAREIPTLPGVH